MNDVEANEFKNKNNENVISYDKKNFEEKYDITKLKDY